jgi:DNA polymerase-4
MGRRLWRFARGMDDRRVNPDAPSKSISAETTFGSDIRDAAGLGSRLWPLCEKVSRRLKKADLAGKTVVLKLKTAGFATRTRNQALADPTQLAEVIYRAAKPMLDREADGTPFRLIGVGVTGLSAGAEADPTDIFNPRGGRMADVERAMDTVRTKFGDKAILKGRGLKPAPRSR